MNARTYPFVAAAQRSPADALDSVRAKAAARGGSVALAWVARLALCGLGACNKTASNLPQAGVIQPTTPVATVPTAETVFAAPTVAPSANATAGRANSSLTRSEEANAMPLPGQNNDHSAPVLAASAAK